MASPFIDDLKRQIDEQKKRIDELVELTKILTRVKIEGHGKIQVMGAEIKVNANTDVAGILNRITALGG